MPNQYRCEEHSTIYKGIVINAISNNLKKKSHVNILSQIS